MSQAQSRTQTPAQAQAPAQSQAPSLSPDAGNGWSDEAQGEGAEAMTGRAEEGAEVPSEECDDEEENERDDGHDEELEQGGHAHGFSQMTPAMQQKTRDYWRMQSDMRRFRAARDEARVSRKCKRYGGRRSGSELRRIMICLLCRPLLPPSPVHCYSH